MRAKLISEKRGSKRWWKIANVIMDVSSSSVAIPALESWNTLVYTPEDKTDVFADSFASKFLIPGREFNAYSIEWPHRVSSSFVLVRSRSVARCLQVLDIDSGTVPAGLASRVLKECARQLSLPLAKLILKIFAQDFWPSSWIVHWLLPLHKRKQVSDPLNYKAINLTSQISKVVERFLNQ